MQTIVENGKVIANGVAYIVPEVKNGTKVALTLSAYSSKFCLVNYKDRSGIMRSHKAFAEFMLPDDNMQSTAGKAVGLREHKPLTPMPNKILVASKGSSGRNGIDIDAVKLWRELCKKWNISEYRRISQETYDKIVRHLRLGVTINCSAKLLGVTYKTIETYRDIYRCVTGHGYKLVLTPNTNKKVKALSVATLQKLETENAE